MLWKSVGKLLLLLSCCTIGNAAFSQSPPLNFQGVYNLENIPSVKNGKAVNLTSGSLYAIFHTSEGDIITKLFPDKAPNTVKNFEDLISGKKSWRHPVSLRETTQSVYSNTFIYRIIPNAMIFGGDPINTGEADSGGLLPIEINPTLNFDKPGYLAMDNNGTIASSSRWFMTLRPFPDRSARYSIFGKIVGGIDIVQRISLKPTKRPQLPLDPVQLGWVEIVRIPAGRMTTGKYEMDNGIPILRINPRFVDMPENFMDESDADIPTTGTAVGSQETSAPVVPQTPAPSPTPVVQYL